MYGPRNLAPADPISVSKPGTTTAPRVSCTHGQRVDLLADLTPPSSQQTTLRVLMSHRPTGPPRMETIPFPTNSVRRSHNPQNGPRDGLTESVTSEFQISFSNRPESGSLDSRNCVYLASNPYRSGPPVIPRGTGRRKPTRRVFLGGTPDTVGTGSREQPIARTQTGKPDEWYASSGDIWKRETWDYAPWLRYGTPATYFAVG